MLEKWTPRGALITSTGEENLTAMLLGLVGRPGHVLGRASVREADRKGKNSCIYIKSLKGIPF